MPPVQINNEASKTVILNLDLISKSLHRNSSHIIKFLSINFGCTCVFTPKYALNGSYDIQKIQNGIYDFIDIFVSCKSCKNPETRFVFEKDSRESKDQALARTCNSCGSTITQENHKLNAMIIKDKDKLINEDTKYEISNKNTLTALLKAEGDQSQQILESFEQEKWTLSQIFSENFKAKDIKNLSLIFKKFEFDQILENLENMLENNKKEDKVDLFLKALLKIGYSVDEIENYFTKPRKDKKRSSFLKKNVDFFIENKE